MYSKFFLHGLMLSRAPVENMSQSDTDFKNETKAFVDVVMINLPASQNRIELIKTESDRREHGSKFHFATNAGLLFLYL
jgi:hypothetical protein